MNVLFKNSIVFFSVIGFILMGFDMGLNPERFKKRIFKAIGLLIYTVFLFIVGYAIYYTLTNII